MLPSRSSVWCLGAVLMVSLATVAAAAPLPRHEYDQRLYLSAGESPDYQQLFQDGSTEANGVLRYEPRYHWRSGDTEWHRWDAEVRAKLLVAAGRPSSLQADENGRIREDEHYAELRDAWVRRRMLFGQPSLSLALGRQTYKDEEGLMWDGPLESLHFAYQASQWRAMVAVGQQLSSYRSDDSDLDPRDEDVRRVFLGAGQQWLPGHWWDWQMHWQDDVSGTQKERIDDLLDVRDFNGYWSGLRLQGEAGSDTRIGYILNGIYQEGNSKTFVASGAGGAQSDESIIRGHFWMAELYGRLDNLSWRPSLGVRAASTDAPETDRDGYFQSRLQSNRRAGVADLSTGVFGDMLDYEMHNLEFVAAYYRQQLWPRADLEVLGGALKRMDPALRVSSPIRNPLVGGEDDLGRVLNVALGWRSYPLAISERRQMQLSARLSYSAFEMGDAYQRAEQIHQVLLVIAGRW
ncbi:MAG: alginate export family protein [Pseudomonadales bacterium]|nr:alginate export family protein [Pseudomonadales bacterium]